jgi:type IV pilus assembly protein PilA
MPCRGFTVIELVLVIAVTSIVGALGYSAWRTHEVRQQVAEGTAGARALQDEVAQSFRRSGEVPATEEGGRSDSPAGHPARFVASMTVDAGRIDLVYGGEADSAIAGRRISLTPYETAAADVVWLCGNEIPGPGLQPLGFAGGGRQARQIPTTIEARYLPPDCR